MKKRTGRTLLLLLFLAVAVPVAVTLVSNEDPRPPPARTIEPGATGESPPPPVPIASVDEKEEIEPMEEARRVERKPGVSPPPGPEDRPAPPAAERRTPDGFFRRLAGVVVDVGTGKPVAGAKLLYGPFPNSWGATTNESGRFDLRIDPKQPDPAIPYRLRVNAAGYEEYDAVPDLGTLRLELVPIGAVPPTGWIRGRAEDKDGRPVRGIVSVVLGDGEVPRHYLVVHADEHGAFRLEGVPPGGWTIRLMPGDTVDVFVPEGGEVPVTLRGRAHRLLLEKGRLSKEERDRVAALAKERDLLSAEKNRLQASPGQNAQFQAILERLSEVRLEHAHLAAKRDREASRREVRVTDVPGPDGARLVAKSVGRSTIERWWAVVENGRSRFPALYPGQWTFTLKIASGDKGGTATVSSEGDVRFPGK